MNNDDSSQIHRPFHRLLQRKVPDFLWHYTSAPGFHGIAKSSKIWATQIQYLNDSQEFIEATGLCRSLLKQREHEQSEVWRKQLISYLSESLRRIEKANVCVSSFTEENDLLSQWRGYCPPSGGYCLGIKSDFLVEQFKKVHFTIIPCVYKYAEKHELLVDAIDITLPELLQTPEMDPERMQTVVEPIVQRFLAMIHEVAPIIKHPSFAEEKEWRAVSPLVPCNLLEFRTQAGILKPYLEVPLELNSTEVQVVVGPSPHSNLGVESCMTLLTKYKIWYKPVECSSVPFRSL